MKFTAKQGEFLLAALALGCILFGVAAQTEADFGKWITSFSGWGG